MSLLALYVLTYDLMTFNGNARGSSKDITMNMIRILANYKKGLRVVHINAQSINNKADEFKFVFENSGIDVVCVSETWLSESTSDSFICPYGFKVFRCDRVSHGGGVAIFVRKGISCKVCCKSTEPGIEFIFIEILSFGRKLLVGCV